MTLLLTLLCPQGIYQSSDYRLTTLRGASAIPEDDVAGAKQLSVSSSGLAAQVCFTGVAHVGRNRTRDWISEILALARQPIDIDLIASEIAIRGTEAVRLIPVDRKMLTVVIAAAKPGQKPRLVLISNMDRLGGPRRTQPGDSLEVFSFGPSRPELFVLGCDVGVSRTDRKFLEAALRSGSDFKSIMDALSAVNARAARNPASKGLISEGCMASSLLADGRTFSINYGEVKGIPDSFHGGLNLGKLLRDNLPGKDAAIRQSAGISATSVKGAPELLPVGEPRTFRFSNPSTSTTGLANTSGGEFDKLTIEGFSGLVYIRKNEPVSVVLGKIHFEAGPTGPTPRNENEIPFFARFAIPNSPTIDGAQPRNWNYPFDVLVDGPLHVLKIRQLSTALRSVNLSKPLPILGPTEQLEMRAPKNGLTLTARSGAGAVISTLEAEFELKDFPELGPSVTSRSVSITLPTSSQPNSNPVRRTPKVGRNEECPCGSGKKYKKCHGR